MADRTLAESGIVKLRFPPLKLTLVGELQLLEPDFLTTVPDAIPECASATGTVTIPFMIQNDLSQEKRNKIARAVHEYDQKTCIR